MCIPGTRLQELPRPVRSFPTLTLRGGVLHFPCFHGGHDYGILLPLLWTSRLYVPPPLPQKTSLLRALRYLLRSSGFRFTRAIPILPRYDLSDYMRSSLGCPTRSDSHPSLSGRGLSTQCYVPPSPATRSHGISSFGTLRVGFTSLGWSGTKVPSFVVWRRFGCRNPVANSRWVLWCFSLDFVVHIARPAPLLVV